MSGIDPMLFVRPQNVMFFNPLPTIIANEYNFPLQCHTTGSDEHGVNLLYSIQDWIFGLTQSPNSRVLWRQIKNRAEFEYNAVKMPYKATNDRTYQMEFADTANIFKITIAIQHPFAKALVNWWIDLLYVVDTPMPIRDDIVKNHIQGYVYVVHGINTKFYKIGHSSNPIGRVKLFGAKMPMDIEMAYLFKTDDRYALESELHSKFQSKCVNNSEWFDLDDDDLAQLDQMALLIGIDLLTGQKLLPRGVQA